MIDREAFRKAYLEAFRGPRDPQPLTLAAYPWRNARYWTAMRLEPIWTADA